MCLVNTFLIVYSCEVGYCNCRPPQLLEINYTLARKLCLHSFLIYILYIYIYIFFCFWDTRKHKSKQNWQPKRTPPSDLQIYFLFNIEACLGRFRVVPESPQMVGTMFTTKQQLMNQHNANKIPNRGCITQYFNEFHISLHLGAACGLESCHKYKEGRQGCQTNQTGSPKQQKRVYNQL